MTSKRFPELFGTTIKDIIKIAMNFLFISLGFACSLALLPEVFCLENQRSSPSTVSQPSTVVPPILSMSRVLRLLSDRSQILNGLFKVYCSKTDLFCFVIL
jgi:hypothetical protein